MSLARQSFMHPLTSCRNFECRSGTEEVIALFRPFKQIFTPVIALVGMSIVFGEQNSDAVISVDGDYFAVGQHLIVYQHFHRLF